MNRVLAAQLALDYCCTEADILGPGNVFSVHSFLPGRRCWQEGNECYLKIAAFGGKLLFAGREDIVDLCRRQYADRDGEWFFEAKNLRLLNDRIHADGYRIESVHPFFIAEEPTSASARDYSIEWYDEAAIERFRGDERFGEAFAFYPNAPDVLGVSASKGGTILGMAGASCDSPTMWQIGINVEPDARQRGIGTLLVTLLKNEIIRRGVLPFYGTSMSHIASQRVALSAGFLPAWAELVTAKADGD